VAGQQEECARLDCIGSRAATAKAASAKPARRHALATMYFASAWDALALADGKFLRTARQVLPRYDCCKEKK